MKWLAPALAIALALALLVPGYARAGIPPKAEEFACTYVFAGLLDPGKLRGGLMPLPDLYSAHVYDEAVVWVLAAEDDAPCLESQITAGDTQLTFSERIGVITNLTWFELEDWADGSIVGGFNGRGEAQTVAVAVDKAHAPGGFAGRMEAYGWGTYNGWHMVGRIARLEVPDGVRIDGFIFPPSGS